MLAAPTLKPIGSARTASLACGLLLISACKSTPSHKPEASGSASSAVAVPALKVHEVSYRYRTLRNRSAYIPPQCYTRTQDADGTAHNPCYTCHTEPTRPNYVHDADLQLAYSFADQPRVNPWKNLFVDRSAAVAAISDDEMLSYLRKSNYFDDRHRLRLAEVLRNPPREWDFDSDGKWDGFVPDVWFNFDADGFDRDDQGHYTGWRAFAYYPFPGAFWPTNGATDDVLIRLPQVFRQNSRGEYDQQVYKTNLAIVEALIRERDITIDPVDEAALGRVDIDKSGDIGTANKVAYDWDPLEKRFMWYVGKAHELQQRGDVNSAAGLYPRGTEFFHTVRYIDVGKEGEIGLSAHMREVRYARKRSWLTYSELRARADAEHKEKRDYPDRLRTIIGNHEIGIDNGQGWTYAAFIEDAKGDLRPQTYEELVFCAGCHSGIGATRDGIFSFARKTGYDSPSHGWHHWSQHSMRGLDEPRRADGRPEYAYYLEQNGAGDEFRGNTEIAHKFFDRDGRLKKDMLARLTTDISVLLWPSAQRAIALDKAYLTIVREQSFALGRDPVRKPAANVHERVDEDQPTGVGQTLLAQRLLP